MLYTSVSSGKFFKASENMAAVFKPARTIYELNHDIKAKVTDYLPNKEKHKFVDLFPEVVEQITVFDSLIELEGGMAAKVDLFHNFQMSRQSS